jgi:hypothetical protein
VHESRRWYNRRHQEPNAFIALNRNDRGGGQHSAEEKQSWFHHKNKEADQALLNKQNSDKLN